MSATTKKAPAAAPRQLTGVDMTTVQLIPMELLHRSPYQVRREGDVSELAADIQAHGLINPITVRRRSAGDGFEVVAGHRRWAAMRSVEPEAEVPCIILDVDDRTAEELLVAENFVRADLSIMEQAETVALLTEHGRTAEECGKVCKRSVRWAHRMRAIGGIGEPWRGFLHVAGLPYACALAVARLPEAVREGAWRAYCDDLATDLCDADASEEKRAEVAAQASNLLRDPEQGLAQGTGAAFDRVRGWMVGVAADEELRERLATVAGVRGFLEESPENGPRFAADDSSSPIGGALSRFRVLEDAPFDRKACAKCARRSDAAPDLWGEDDGTAAPARCLDCECWTRRVAEHVRKTLEAAAARGVTAEPVRSASYNWCDVGDLDGALAAADGDASRVTPVVRVFGDAEDRAAQPTGRVLWRVAEPAEEEDEPAEESTPPKREPWEEWRPENPRWTPMLHGDALARAWLHVGLLLGAASSAFLADEKLGDVTDDVAALLVRCDLLDRAAFDHATILKRVGQLITPAERKLVTAAWEVYAEARKHLPATGGEADGEAWEDGDNE